MIRKNKKFIDPRYFMDEKMELNEGLKDYIKSNAIHSSIPAGSLMNVLQNNPELRDKLHNALAAARGDASRLPAAFPLMDKFAQLLAQDPAIARSIGGDPIENHLNVRGLLVYADQNMPQIWS